MKKLVLISSFMVMGLGSIVGVFFLAHIASVHALSVGQYTCQANGAYASITSGAGAVTPDDQQAATRSLAWINAQTKTRSLITTESTLAPNVEEASSYTGPIDGTFTLNGATYPTQNDAPLTITSPSTVSDTYAGIVQGHVLTTPTQWRWIIQVYKKTSSGYVQVPKQALADGTTGEFTIDLSDISNPPAGQWAFGILDANNSYAPYGSQWPAENYYDGLEVQQKLVTDAIYDWSTTKAYADGTFHFDNSNTGKKLFRLVDTATGNILAEYVKPTGLVRSFELDPSDPDYGTAFADRSFVYDQAVALFAALGANDQALATTLVDGLLTLQETSGAHTGAFVFASSQLTPDYRDALIRTGAHSIATDALLAYIQKYPQATNISAYTQAAQSALDFIDTTQSHSGTTDGLYLGGFGDYSGTNNSFVASTVIDWASTEHNIDTWQTFMRASAVLGNTSTDYLNKAKSLQVTILNKLYNSTEKRYNQGMTASGPDSANPLDVNSWGAIQLYGSGEYDKAIQALSQLSPFSFTRNNVTGYAPFYDTGGYPGAVPNVWFEGSFGVALAQLRTGDTSDYRTLIESLKTAQQGDGSFLYATDNDPTYEITNRKAIASTAWYILATTGRDAIWNYCEYAPPTDAPSNPSTPSGSSNNGESQTPTQSASASTSQNSSSSNTSPSEIQTDTTTIQNPESLESPQKNNDTSKSTPTKNETTDDPHQFPWVPVIATGSGIIIVGGGIALVARRLRG